MHSFAAVRYCTQFPKKEKNREKHVEIVQLQSGGNNEFQVNIILLFISQQFIIFCVFCCCKK